MSLLEPNTLFLAAGFASSAMLLWMAAASIPILIHLLTRRRQRSVPWAAMQLLHDVLESEARRVRLEQLILLIVRAAVLAVLALALARPYWTDPGNASSTDTSREPQLWILGIDVSYSMGYRVDGVARIEMAKEKAVELISDGQQGDAYALIELGVPARARIFRPTFDQEQALSEVRRLRALDTNSDILSGLRIASDLAKEATQSPNLPQTIDTILISDAGRDAWEPVIQTEQRSLLSELQKVSDLEIISLTSDKTQNIALTSLEPGTFQTLVGQSISLTARLENFGSTDVLQLPVQLAVDGKILESKFVDVPANAASVLTFSYTPQKLGPQVITAALGADNLLADNERACVIQVTDQYRLLFVERDPGSTQLLQLSLKAEFSAGRQSTFQTTSKFELLTQNLDEWDAIVVDDLSTVDSLLIERLAQYVRGGGKLFFCFGPNANAEAWNSTPQATELLGFELNNPSAVGNWQIDPLDYISPVVSVFSGYPDSGLLTTPLFRYWKITPQSNNLTIDLAVDSSDPLLVRHSLQRGWIASLLTPPQSPVGTGKADETINWNAMATWPSFVPLMSQLMKTLLAANAADYNLMVGQPLVGEYLAPNAKTVDIVTPEGVETQVVSSPVADSPLARWQYDQTRVHGIYQARSPNGTTTPYAVNLNPIESGLETVSLRQLPSSSERRPLTSTRQKESTDPLLGYALSRWLLIALLVLLLVESGFAWTIGRRIG